MRVLVACEFSGAAHQAEGAQVSQYDTAEKRKRHREYQWQWRRDNPEKHAEIQRASRLRTGANIRDSKRHRLNNPLKVQARRKLSNAVRDGRIIRPTRCSKCMRSCKPQGHHPDYSKFLEIVWLCRPCHLIEEGKAARISVAGDSKP